MDSNNLNLKDAEKQQRDEQQTSLPLHPPVAKPRTSVCPNSGQKPPIKPRRSIRSHPAAQKPEMEQLTLQDQQKHYEVKRMDPALVLSPICPLDPLTLSLRSNTLLWFERTQLPRLHMPGRPLPGWLHGFTTRREAELLLQDQPQGCFLLRLSESKIGFVLSYRGEDRCRHFIIEEEPCETFGSVYLIAGENSRHQTLEKLICFYAHNPVGPFNELLTVPCIEPCGDTDDNDRWRDKETAVNVKEEKTKLQIAVDPAVLTPLPTTSCQISSGEVDTVQYAAVRKPLKKTVSLPECNCGIETAPSIAQIATPKVSERPPDPLPVEAPYARVNKPSRAMAESTFSANTDLQGVRAAPFPHPFDSAADSKYWKLEPMHTYEETQPTLCKEEIDCYAIGWRKLRDSGFQNHVYSEVNIKGAKDDLGVPRPGPSLPLRPPPRFAHGTSLDVSPLVAQPRDSNLTLRNSSSNSIYEQIPERYAHSRQGLQPSHPRC
ncbi:hypothetical protein DNTS_034566 [Danionella cerebrum]|uniref:SH2 domain-containing protein n=1 Tax=Danionella cerebrum TaxID=2873325 RepID=A0A553MZX9_9TELE|nr:hypothetical protein DNTS_034566 [Danionella translucida]